MSGGRNEREEGSNANEGERLYRYVPAAVVCNIMITLPACAWLPSSLLSSLSFSLSRSSSRFPPARIPSGHPLSAAMLPGNMIIVIICTLLRSYPPDSSPLRNSPVILPAWLPPFSHSLFLRISSFLSFSLFLLRSIPAVVPSCVMLHSSLFCTPLLVTQLSLSLFHRRLSRVILRLHSPAPPSSVCRSLTAAAARRIERKRTRTGPKQPPVNRDHVPLSSLSSFVFRRASTSSSLLSLFLCRPPFFLRSLGKLYNAKYHPCVALFGSLLLYLSFYHPLSFSLSSSLRVGPLFFRLSLVLASSFVHCSSPQQLSARGSFQLVPAETFHRPPFSAFFLRAFSRLLKLFSRI